MPVHLQKELERLKKRILSLGAMVEERVRMAARALEQRDPVTAEQIIATDYEIDELEVEVEEECLKILALHQPVAVDLRFLTAVVKINKDLERIGDEAVNIADCVAVISRKTPLDVSLGFGPMAEKAQSMFKKSLDALVNLDLDEAFRVLTLDDEVDQIYRSISHQVKDMIRRTPDRVECLINLLMISRYLERIADHATNIAEEVVYMIEGEIIRHGKWDQPEA
ncbi:MAG: phosphate signaling complex protein PhoU [Thermodesulfobacteriota bacterium]